MIHVGTSGYGYHEWDPVLYPPGLCYDDYFAYYAKHFDCLEINATFFSWPKASELERLLRGVADVPWCTLKLHRKLTHFRDGQLTAARSFASALEPLVETGKLGAVLAQFPFSFINHPDNRAYLCRLRAALDLPLVAELRNTTWFNPETLDFLRGWGIGIACIDAPALGGLPRPSARATSSVGYVRFHGRQAEHWWPERDGRRYAYRYRRRELVSWLPRLREIAKHAPRTFVVFNNHRHGHAVTNALALKRLLEAKGTSKARARAG